MLDMTKMFAPGDGYCIIEDHSKDEVVQKIIIDAMLVKGYKVYGRSVLEGSVQLNFVTDEFAEVLRERHLHSCRNSLGLDPQSISRLFRPFPGPESVEVIEVELPIEKCRQIPFSGGRAVE